MAGNLTSERRQLESQLDQLKNSGVKESDPSFAKLKAEYQSIRREEARVCGNGIQVGEKYM